MSRSKRLVGDASASQILEPPEGGFLTWRAMARQLPILYLEPLSARYPDMGHPQQCYFLALFAFVKKQTIIPQGPDVQCLAWNRDMLVLHLT